jgi:hypothetical protein
MDADGQQMLIGVHRRLEVVFLAARQPRKAPNVTKKHRFAP